MLVASCDRPTPEGAKPEIVKAPATLRDGHAWVRDEVSKAARDGRKVLIYVGAPWCDPCVRFHDSVVTGQLDQELPSVRLLELDHDEHEALLAPSDLDCQSQLIPLFARPTPEGRCGLRRVEGGVKGDRAVGFLLPKVKALLTP